MSKCLRILYAATLPFALVLFLLLLSSCQAKKVYFVNIQEGAELTSPFKVKMGAQGLDILPAGPVKKNSGHHHILINRGPIPKGKLIPTDENHLHFGAGQIETMMELAPGEYKLTLQFADGVHRSYGPELSSSVHIKVVK